MRSNKYYAIYKAMNVLLPYRVLCDMIYVYARARARVYECRECMMRETIWNQQEARANGFSRLIATRGGKKKTVGANIRVEKKEEARGWLKTRRCL